MSGPGIPDIAISCVVPGCPYTAICTTSLLDAETHDGKPTVILRVDVSQLTTHRRAIHPELT